MLAQLKGLFTPQAVAASMKLLTPLETTIMDTLFKDRPTHPLPLIGVSELVSVVQPCPLFGVTVRLLPSRAKRPAWNLSRPCRSRSKSR